MKIFSYAIIFDDDESKREGQVSAADRDDAYVKIAIENRGDYIVVKLEEVS